jgi:hypothetical protein
LAGTVGSLRARIADDGTWTPSTSDRERFVHWLAVSRDPRRRPALLQQPPGCHLRGVLAEIFPPSGCVLTLDDLSAVITTECARRWPKSSKQARKPVPGCREAALGPPTTVTRRPILHLRFDKGEPQS